MYSCSLGSPAPLQALRNVFLGPGCHSAPSSAGISQGKYFGQLTPPPRQLSRGGDPPAWQGLAAHQERLVCGLGPSTASSLGKNSATSLSGGSVEWT